MNEYTSTWSLTQFSSQAAFNICIILCAYGFNLTTVQTSMLSQSGTTIFCMIFLTWGWKLIPNRPRKHKLPKGQSILLAGFTQNWRTCKSIWKNYKTGLRWFLISTVFGEAAASGVTTTAVIFLNGNLQLSPLQIGIFFQVSLMTVIVGTKVRHMYIYAHICLSSSLPTFLHQFAVPH
jgi:MFS-type transporter involved in bile tolerance (Atg22 family)